MSDNSDTAIAVDYTMVTDNEALAALCMQWQKCELLALDTEFIRTQTYFPKLGLLQLGDGDSVWLIDPLEITDWTDFKALLENSEITKVMHSCTEDLLTFIAFFGILPSPIFDTQVAATLLDMGLSLSYQNLIRHFKGIDLPKGETRSDWLQRPLTESQLDYAAMDVLYLPEIARQQVTDLEDQGKVAWAEEEFTRLLNGYNQEFTKDFSTIYLGMKGAWQYSGLQLLALKELASWRESRARERDKPRSWIIKDTALYDIARIMPDSRSELAAIDDVSPNFMRFEGDSVLAIIEAASRVPENQYPPEMPRPLTSGQKKLLKSIRALVEEKSRELKVPVEYLGRRKTLVEFLQNHFSGAPLPDELKGWRGEQLLTDLTSFAEAASD